MTIELTKEECFALERLLDTAIQDLGPEVRRTTTREYKEELKHEKRILQDVYDRLCAATATA